MVMPFLPASVKALTEPESIAAVQSVRRCAISTPLASTLIQTAYVQQGQGDPPILLLHGFDSSLLEFRYLLPRLATIAETWSVDLLGFGFTDRPSGIAFNPRTIQAHLYEFWRAMIGRRMVLVGASMGGAAAIAFALAYPTLVERLVLIDSLGYTIAPPLVKFLFPPIDYWAVEYLRQRKLKALEISMALGTEAKVIDLIRCSLLHTEMAGWHEAMIAFTKSGGYDFLADQICKIRQPTLILWGESDDVLGTADALRFRREIADSQLVWIRECKHVPHIEQPEVMARHILSFKRWQRIW